MEWNIKKEPGQGERRGGFSTNGLWGGGGGGEFMCWRECYPGRKGKSSSLVSGAVSSGWGGRDLPVL